MGGRPSITFSESSDRTKRRKTKDIRDNRTSEELVFATKMSLRAEGKLDAAHVLQDITSGSPSQPSTYRKLLQMNEEKTLSDNDALSLLIESRLSKNQYLILRQTSKGKNCKLFPPYSNVLQAKKTTTPMTQN